MKLLLVGVNPSPPTTGPVIKFPSWVKGPTPCKYRTFTVVLSKRVKGKTRHGAIRLEKSMPNRPTETMRNTLTGEMNTIWAGATLKEYEELV